MDYESLVLQLKSLAEADADYVPFLSNASALLYDAMPNLNWAGFYLIKNGQLVLGPFQGKVACIHIPIGKGVCGTAVSENRTVRVANVHEFAGHIACDSASNSELVIPIRKDGIPVGVLDLDSPLLSRFTERDQAGLEQFVKTLEQLIRF
ncbi:MAG: GAF domain-containing protein [Clostridia bacterium]|nr:GAF domain-containing protein [Clostridia bacterium]